MILSFVLLGGTSSPLLDYPRALSSLDLEVVCRHEYSAVYSSIQDGYLLSHAKVQSWLQWMSLPTPCSFMQIV